jgi:WD40 repeat protein
VFAHLNFIFSGPEYTDYRPASNPTGELVLFERTPVGGGITELWLVTSDGTAYERFIRPGSAAMNTGPSQTRPDWSWVTGQVALNVAKKNGGAVEVLITSAEGTPLMNVPDSKGYVYPTWTGDGTELIVMNKSGEAQPQPSTSLVALDGSVKQHNLNGKDSAGVLMYGGFATPNPRDPTLIAYAGQPALEGWAGTHGGGYDQDYNYVFLNSKTEGRFESVPMEAEASVAVYKKAYQGRAPVWSPSGKYVAFESKRAGWYAVYLANLEQKSAPVQITDASYDAQHPKFRPDGKSLVLSALQKPNQKGPRGIAWVDISSYLV